MNAEDRKAIEAMQANGGSFVSRLGFAASAADPENLAKLKAAFPDLFARYAAMERGEE